MQKGEHRFARGSFSSDGGLVLLRATERRHWPRTRLTVRGNSHCGRPEAMDWCEDNGVGYIFGLVGNAALRSLAYDFGDDLKARRAETGADRLRGFVSFDRTARSRDRKRGFDTRYVVTSRAGEPRRLSEEVCSARG